MINIYTLYNQVNFTSEQIILFGLLDKEPREPEYTYNHRNENRYHGIIEFCKKNINYTDTPEGCDILVLPYKFKDITDPTYIKLNTISKQLNKPLWCFYNDDNDKIFNIPSNVILFRTSFYKTTQLDNEKALIAYSTDYFNNKYIINDTIADTNLTIGYCGHLNNGRHKYLHLLHNSELTTNFIIRHGFWAPGVDKLVAKNDFINNIENNLFIFCYRGAGNFSYRFYETLMMARIPILINTDCVFPFENNKNINIHIDIDINDLGLVINEKDIDINNNTSIITIIKDYYTKNKYKLLDIQKNNRLVWEKYYSPIGFLSNIINHNY